MPRKYRKYQDVYKLLDENPGMTPAEAGRQLGYKIELHWKSKKKDRRVGPRHRGSDGQRTLAEEKQRIGPRNIPTSQPGFERHHKRMIMLYKPLYEGLSKDDALKLSQHALDVGMPLGDVGDNYQLLPKVVHDKVHRYMEREGMRPSQMPNFSKTDLSTRIKAFDVLYRDYIQPDIDRATDSFLNDYQVEIERAKGFRKGVNVLAEGFKNGAIRATKNLVPYAGTVSSGLHTANRIQEFKDDPSILNGIQTVASSIETAANGVSDFLLSSGVGSVAAVIPEKIGAFAGGADEMIDTFEQLNNNQ